MDCAIIWKRWLLSSLLLCCTASADEATDAFLKVRMGELTPIQMSDGSKRWRFVRQIQRDDNDQLLAELIGQSLARSLWCSSGWQQTAATTTKGYFIAEGRCK